MKYVALFAAMIAVIVGAGLYASEQPEEPRGDCLRPYVAVPGEPCRRPLTLMLHTETGAMWCACEQVEFPADLIETPSTFAPDSREVL